MKILWISSLAWKSKDGYPYPVNGAGAVAGALFQQSMIEGLENLGHTIDIVSDYPYSVGSNSYSQIEWSHNGMSEDISIKTIDIPYCSILYKAYSLKKAVKHKVNLCKYDVAVAYLIHQPYMETIAYAKKIDPKIRTVLICPDLPDMMDMSLDQKKVKTFFKKIDKWRIEYLYKKMDGFVLFAEAMREKIIKGTEKYTVIEGIATTEGLDITPVKKENFIMYAGTLHRNIGIENIILSLDFLEDKSIQLKVYGTGELESYVREQARINSRVIYGGFVDRSVLFEEQKRAIALVNARNPLDTYTKYSFPSKTFEFLYSGTPFVTTKLDGVPKDYSKYLFEIEDNNPRTIANSINEICKTNVAKISAHGCDAREFILREKTSKSQSEKLSKFLDYLCKKGGLGENFEKRERA